MIDTALRSDEKSDGFDWRRRADSNRRITDLQSAALPLGYGAVALSSRRSIAYLRDTFQLARSRDGLMR